ncbi:hypothetical protein BKA70DRAFT_1315458 [Coprinopsis sp. MPI-PUGE-AT-0042]|nr:hypothetical protein BKA70DRAFT_1315458 [Coprinopsis sp. MPI-PUGE-AT-0042]
MLKKTRPSRKFLQSQQEGQKCHSKAKATMPLELLYTIIDDYRMELAQDNGRALRSLAHTCRALAAYCRPLLLQFITLYTLDAPIPQTSWLGPITRPGGFSRLASTYPSSASLVKELRVIVLKPYPPKKQRVLKKLGIDVQRSEMKPWQVLLKASYPRLSTLHLMISWNRVSPLLTKALFKAIKTTPTLETLELDGNGVPLQHVIQILPPTLKRFSLLGGGTVPSSPYEWTPGLGPELESLTILDPTWLRVILRPELSPFNLAALAHLRIRPPDSMSVISWLHQSPSHTLRCLHVHLDRLQYVGHPLNVSNFCILTHLEFIMDGVWDKLSVDLALDWVGKSVNTLGARSSPKVMERLSTLTICFLFQLPVAADAQQKQDDVYNEQLDTWQSAFASARWRCLEPTRIVGFITVIRYPNRPFPRYFFPCRFVEVDTPRPLPARGGATVSPYEALWKSCGCTGRRRYL